MAQLPPQCQNLQLQVEGILQLLHQEPTLRVQDTTAVRTSLNKALAPKFSGELAASGYVSGYNKSNYVKKKWHWRERKSYNPFAVVIAFAARTAHLVEYGTVKMGAKPFLRPALDEAKQAAGDAVIVHLSKSLEKKLNK